MASKSEINCGPCEYSKLFVPADVWCQLCEEGLCNDCTKHHKAAKATRTHEPVPISFNIPNKMFEVNTECQLHNEKFELYCPSHEMHCCVQCANGQHSECKGITLLNKFIENIKSSEVLASLKQTFQDRTKSLDELKENRFSNIRKIEEQSYKIVDEFESFQEKVHENLNKYKHRLKAEAKELKATKKQTVMQTVDKLELRKTVYDEMLTSLAETERIGNNLQVYLMMKNLDKKLEKEDEITKSIEKEDGFRDINMSWSPNSEFCSFTSETNLGMIDIKNTSQVINLKESSGQNALSPLARSVVKQSTVTPTARLGHVDKLTFKTSIDTITATEDYSYGDTINLSSILILPNGNIIITDDGNKGGILLFDKAGYFILKITKFGKAHGACMINESLLAFSFPSNQNIKFIYIPDCSFSSRTLSRTIRINLQCTGLSMSDGKVLACVRPYSIYIIDTDGTILNTLNLGIPAITYVHCYKNEMIVTDFFSDTISCFDMNGKELWTFLFESGEDTRNCCVDQFGNIFLSEKNSGNVLLITPDKQIKTLLKNLDKPKAIAYDRDSKSLIIAGSEGIHSAVYNINLI